MTKAEILAAMQVERTRHSAAMATLHGQLRLIEMEEESRNREAYKQRKALLKETGEWVKDKLAVGDWVQVTGSRAGAYRRVVAINAWGIVGTVIERKRIRTAEGAQLKWVIDHGKVTEQGFNKITHLYREEQFVPVKELMQDEVDQTPSLE
jgi:hypothetical protein